MLIWLVIVLRMGTIVFTRTHMLFVFNTFVQLLITNLAFDISVSNKLIFVGILYICSIVSKVELVNSRASIFCVEIS